MSQIDHLPQKHEYENNEFQEAARSIVLFSWLFIEGTLKDCDFKSSDTARVEVNFEDSSKLKSAYLQKQPLIVCVPCDHGYPEDTCW